MPMRRRIPVATGRSAVRDWQAAPEGAPRATLATGVRYSLEELGIRAPGRSVEVRVPPFGAVQVIEGPVHTRGTPPNVIETDAQTWLSIVTGSLPWVDAVQTGRVRTSGQRADLSDLVPLFPAVPAAD